MAATHSDSQFFYHEHHEEVLLYFRQEPASTDMATSLLHLSLNQSTEVEAQHVYFDDEDDEDQMDVTTVEEQLLGTKDPEEADTDRASTSDYGSSLNEATRALGLYNQPAGSCVLELPWYYFIRISPVELNPDDIIPTYRTIDSFQVHTWIMADREMGISVMSYGLLEYLPLLGRDNVDLIGDYLEDYLEKFLEHNLGTRLWVYVVMPENEYDDLVEVMGLQVHRIRSTLTNFEDELSVTVHIINSMDGMKGD